MKNVNKIKSVTEILTNCLNLICLDLKFLKFIINFKSDWIFNNTLNWFDFILSL